MLEGAMPDEAGRTVVCVKTGAGTGMERSSHNRRGSDKAPKRTAVQVSRRAEVAFTRKDARPRPTTAATIRVRRAAFTSRSNIPDASMVCAGLIGVVLVAR